MDDLLIWNAADLDSAFKVILQLIKQVNPHGIYPFTPFTIEHIYVNRRGIFSPAWSFVFVQIHHVQC